MLVLALAAAAVFRSTAAGRVSRDGELSTAEAPPSGKRPLFDAELPEAKRKKRFQDSPSPADAAADPTALTAWLRSNGGTQLPQPDVRDAGAQSFALRLVLAGCDARVVVAPLPGGPTVSLYAHEALEQIEAGSFPEKKMWFARCLRVKLTGAELKVEDVQTREAAKYGGCRCGDSVAKGTQLMQVADAAACLFGADRMRLDDQAHVVCAKGGFDAPLSLLASLTRGMGWYEKLGYRYVSKDGTALPVRSYPGLKLDAPLPEKEKTRLREAEKYDGEASFRAYLAWLWGNDCSKWPTAIRRHLKVPKRKWRREKRPFIMFTPLVETGQSKNQRLAFTEPGIDVGGKMVKPRPGNCARLVAPDKPQ